MKNVIKELQQRKIIKDITNEDKLNKLTVDDSLYIGFDPTAESLHLGNYLQIKILKHFINAGFKPIAVLGGATGMIGDPSFKDSERQLLDEETLLKNKKHITAQFHHFGLEVFDNYDIYKNMNILQFLRDAGKHINVSVMLNKEMVAQRIEKGLSFTEFSYQLIQGWDFKYLYEHKNVKLQMGGSDQWGNIVTGIDIIKKVVGEDNLATGITINLLTDSQGNKFGKSTGGGSLWLDKNKTSPYLMYQFLLNQPDEEVEKLLNWLTFISIEKIQEIMTKHFEKPFLRFAQKELAAAVIKDIHGTKELEKVLKITDVLFGGQNILELSVEEIQMCENVLPTLEIEANTKLKEAILSIKAAISFRELKEFYDKNTFELDGNKNIDLEAVLSPQYFDKKYMILKKGKKNYFIFKIK